MNLSKSDFILARSCAKKLVYKKKGYATSNDTDEYMQMLAQGGYVVGKMATLLYPDGIEIEGNTKDSLVLTQKYMNERERVVLFEPAFLFEQRLSRVDILVKNEKEKTIELIEVKSKSYDPNLSDSKNGLNKYIEDVAFQYTILKVLYPDYTLKAYLLMPDKSMHTDIDGLAGWFNIIEDTLVENKNIESLDSKIPEEIITQEKPRFVKPDVEFINEYSSSKQKYIEELRVKGILSLKDVTEQVKKIESEIRNAAKEFIDILNNNLECVVPISKTCKSCEFYVKGESNCGFFECWENAKEYPSIFDMYYGTQIVGDDSYFNELIQQGKYDFDFIEEERLVTSKGEVKARAMRQRIQLKNTLNNSEWFNADFKSELQQHSYPLHFIDFETYTGAVPFYKGMRPYELIAFQWSCHTIEKPGAEPIHKEWIHTEKEIPNFQFAEQLMQHIGTNGTVFMWATHENTVLRRIYYQMDEYAYVNDELKDWLQGIVKYDKLGWQGRLIDMNAMTVNHYFHPYMKGKTSIKKVLPAIWNHNPYLHHIPWFKEYSGFTAEADVIDPYDLLFKDYHEEVDEEDFSSVEQVQGGTAAMRAYRNILFNTNYSDAQKNELKKRLLEYCRLDTMAMVIIYTHWRNHFRMQT